MNLDPLTFVREKERLCVVGLMSGTSIDGIDAAIVDLWFEDGDLKYELRGFSTVPIPIPLRQEILEICEGRGDIRLLCRLNFLLGDLFADTVMFAIDAAGIDVSEVDLIGSHGQTVCHFPYESPPSTLQIGEPSIIAQRTGIVTISDFRPADMAVGGQGAPLVPLADHLLFADSKRGRMLLNIGGIANVTVLPSGRNLGNICAFDTGPGNMLIDAAVEYVSSGTELFDENGTRASKGEVNEKLLKSLLSHSYFCRRPPKSTGREEFGKKFFDKMIADSDCEKDSIVTTFTELSAQSISSALDFFTAESIYEIWVAGGGVHNSYLMRRLSQLISGVSVRSLAELGLDPDAREAVSFAVLANQTIHGKAGNIPEATGASSPVVLGKITLP
ncbi:MAG: anhydro-N-acetylmuramic acid kinase [Candidatus Latescibacterota bacterium]|nr:anhydro-N-acetylmuramic acid kinase [Candidatus Latescibacterota bacterium]